MQVHGQISIPIEYVRASVSIYGMLKVMECVIMLWNAAF